MKQDISFDPVEGVAVAIVPTQDALTEDGEPGWQVYLLNYNDFALQNVIINSHGYGTLPGGEAVRTSTLRHVLPEVPPHSAAPIEPLDPRLFALYNQYWVSYYHGAQIFDKKYIFVPESIVPENLVPVAMLQQQGILHP